MKVLVATDGSRAGSAAVRFATRLIEGRRGSRLIVLTVDAATRAGTARPARRPRPEPAESAGSRRVRRVLAIARRADEVPEVISQQADRCRADLIVVGSEGRDSLAEWVVGGTALRLIYVARRPVTVVRAPRRRRPR